MQTAYKLTDHARQRMAERRIAPHEVLAALHKRGTYDRHGILEHYDPETRVTIKVNPAERVIITIYRRQPVRDRRRRTAGTEAA